MKGQNQESKNMNPNDLQKLAQELNDYAELADEIIRLLEQYDKRICENLTGLEKRVNFRKYLK